jgi:hypothetical protein
MDLGQIRRSAFARISKKSPPMSKIPSIAFLVIGAILLAYGINASNSVSSSVSNAVTGSPTNKTIWLIVLGAAGMIMGGFGLLRNDRKL